MAMPIRKKARTFGATNTAASSMARLPPTGVAHASTVLLPSDPPRTQLPEGIFDHQVVRSEFRFFGQSDEEEPKVIVVPGNATPYDAPAPLPMGPVNLIGEDASRPSGSTSRRPRSLRIPRGTRNPRSIHDTHETVAREPPASEDQDAVHLLALRHESEAVDRRIQDLRNDRADVAKLLRDASATVWGPDGAPPQEV